MRTVGLAMFTPGEHDDFLRPLELVAGREHTRRRADGIDQAWLPPVTTKVRHIPSEVPLHLEDGLPKPCVVNLDTITTIAKASLRDRLTTLNAEKQKAVEVALHFALGMET